MSLSSACTPGATQRIRRILLAGVVGLLSSRFAAASPVALLVGVGQFSDPQLQGEQLPGAAADIDAMQQSLTGRWGFAVKDVHTLRDREATHDRILAEISALEQRSAPGDTVLIYFSGHGTSANADNNTYDLPYATGAWVPYDLDFNTVASVQRSLIIGRRDLVPRLKRLDETGRRVVVVSDSCYSGQVVRSLGWLHRHSRYLAIRPRDLGVSRVGETPAVPAASARPTPPPYPYQHVILLSGASDSETGADISTPQDLQQAPTLDGKYHGAFTDAFLRLLNGQFLTGTFSYAQGREAMSAFLEHRNFAQHPQLLPGIAEDPLDLGSNSFLSALQNAAPLPATTALAPRPATAVRVRVEGISETLRRSIAALAGVTVVDRDSDLTVRQRGDQAQLLGPAGDPIVTLAATDPNLLRRLSAQHWFTRTLPAGTETLGLRAETDPVSRGNTFVQCESFVFEVRLKKPAYVMVLDLDPLGGLTVLYPTRPSERQIVPAGTPTAIPGANPKDHIVVTAPFGSDQVAVIAVEQLPTFFIDLTSAERFATDSLRAATLATGLAQLSGAVSVNQITVRTYAGTRQASCGS